MDRESILKKIDEYGEKNGLLCVLNRNYKEFITRDMEVRPMILYPGFYLDDYELYEEALKDVDTTSQRFVVIVANLVNFVAKKFGFYGDELTRQQILINGNVKKDGFVDAVSISEFIGKDAAMCVERSALLHNLLKLLDIDDVLIFGSFESKIQANSGKHCYNLVTTPKGKHALVDATNYTTVIIDGEEKFLPTIVQITDEEYEGLVKKETEYRLNLGHHLYHGEKKAVDWIYS